MTQSNRLYNEEARGVMNPTSAHIIVSLMSTPAVLVALAGLGSLMVRAYYVSYGAQAFLDDFDTLVDYYTHLTPPYTQEAAETAAAVEANAIWNGKLMGAPTTVIKWFVFAMAVMIGGDAIRRGYAIYALDKIGVIDRSRPYDKKERHEVELGYKKLDQEERRRSSDDDERALNNNVDNDEQQTDRTQKNWIETFYLEDASHQQQNTWTYAIHRAWPQKAAEYAEPVLLPLMTYFSLSAVMGTALMVYFLGIQQKSYWNDYNAQHDILDSFGRCAGSTPSETSALELICEGDANQYAETWYTKNEMDTLESKPVQILAYLPEWITGLYILWVIAAKGWAYCHPKNTESALRTPLLATDHNANVNNTTTPLNDSRNNTSIANESTINTSADMSAMPVSQSQPQSSISARVVNWWNRNRPYQPSSSTAGYSRVPGNDTSSSNNTTPIHGANAGICVAPFQDVNACTTPATNNTTPTRSSSAASTNEDNSTHNVINVDSSNNSGSEVSSGGIFGDARSVTGDANRHRSPSPTV